MASSGASAPATSVRRSAAWTRALIRRVHLGTRRPDNWVKLFHFCVIGGVGYVVNLTVFAVLIHAFTFHHIAAAIGAFFVAVSNNFVWNRTWTFRDSAADGHTGFQAARFLAVSIVGLCVNVVALALFVGKLRLPELPAQALAVAIAMPVNFAGNKLWTFA